jgi:hypothetical protein
MRMSDCYTHDRSKEADLNLLYCQKTAVISIRQGSTAFMVDPNIKSSACPQEHDNPMSR